MLPCSVPSIAMVESCVSGEDMPFIFDKKDKGKVVQGSITSALKHFDDISQNNDTEIEIRLVTEILDSTEKTINAIANKKQIDRDLYLNSLQGIKDKFESLNSFKAILVIINGGEERVATFICEESDFITAMKLNELDGLAYSEEPSHTIH